ncbi:hypothetical protein L7F22_040124 [Adiantum nelumboides]|nr:hypothetical protein [Adiantum nelumboides]
MVPHLELELADYKENLDFHIMRLDRAYVILGIPWFYDKQDSLYIDYVHHSIVFVKHDMPHVSVSLCNQISDYSKVAAPLTQLLKGGVKGPNISGPHRKGNLSVVWNERLDESFRTLKSLVTTAPILHIVDPSKLFVVETDASDYANGAALYQDGCPVVFESKKLSDAEMRYPTYEKELYAVVHTLRKWRHYLYGSTFVAWTDHHSLCYVCDQGDLRARKARWVELMQEFDFEIRYKKGFSNRVVDALSRIPEVGSQEIFVVGRDEDDGSSQASAVELDEEVDDAGSWTTLDSLDMHDVEEEQETGDGSETGVCEGFTEGNETDDMMGEASGVPKGRHRANSSIGSQGTALTGPGSEKGLGSTLSLPFTALIRALKFAASLLWPLRGSKRLVDLDQSMIISGVQNESSGSGRVVNVGENEPGDVQSASATTSIFSSDVVNDLGLEASSNDIVQECCPPPTIPATDGILQASDACIFKQFDSVKDTTDHHFSNEASQPSNQRRWSKKIQQEWAMLETCLPESIFVRVYEDRMDLMRSVIVGASGTSYHDGLFFFDLFLPAEYPSSPPHVHYHSGGLRLNPNLYETGKVCLSLLNTWTGKGNEIWHSSSSSILQVLVSIQGLVLNANPYFNEAGYDKQMGTAEGEKNSLAYVENSFLLSCKSMLYLIRQPPTHFEEFVKEHFKKRGPLILQACLAYMEGAPVGSLLEDGSVSTASGKDMEQSTAGFRLMLAKIIPRLIVAFKEVGACCDAYERQLAAIKG